MELRPGITLGLAPRFQSALAWRERMQVNGGVEAEAGHFYPRRDWRAPTDAALTLLLADADAGLARSRVGLLSLPSHVRREWWGLAERGEGLGGNGRDYRAFVAEVMEFLRFKRLPLPGQCRVDVAVSRPGQPSTRWDAADGRPAGLGFNIEGPGGATTPDRVVAIVNLGDEPTHLVLLNLAPSEMAAALGPPPVAPGRELLQRFFTAMPAYPLVRVRLEPGDGVWLPSLGVVYDVCTLDKREIDVALTIRAATGAAPPPP